MSQENLATFHRIYDAWHARRTLGPDLLAENVEWVNPHDAVERGSRQGIDSFNQAIASIFDAWESVRFETERIVESGGEVIALGQVRGRGRGAGIQVARPHGEIWTFRDGKVIRM